MDSWESQEIPYQRKHFHTAILLERRRIDLFECCEELLMPGSFSVGDGHGCLTASSTEVLYTRVEQAQN